RRRREAPPARQPGSVSLASERAGTLSRANRGSWRQPIEFDPDRFDEWFEALFTEVEPAPGRGEELGQRSRSAKRKRRSVRRDRTRAIGQRASPDLERPKLRDRVFYVVKRIDEDVQLTMP